jgi:hypothetical protein
MWLSCPSELFSSWEIIPCDHDDASQTANKLTRLLILVSLVVWYRSPQHLKDVIVYGLLSILTIYAIMKDTERLRTKKEKFSPVPYKMNVSDPSSVSSSTFSSPPLSAAPSSSPYLPSQASQPSQQHQSLPASLQALIEVPVERPQSSTPITALASASLNAPLSAPLNQPSAARLQLPLSVPSVNPLMRTDRLQVAPRQPQQNFTPQMGINPKMYQAVNLPPRIMDSDFSDIETNQLSDFNPLQDMGQRAERGDRTRPKNRGLLMEKTEDCVPAEYVATGNNRFYLQDVQPNVYSFSYDPTPINSNIGITYTPQIPPRATRVMCTPDGQQYPLYTRIDNSGQLLGKSYPEYARQDPQLIRDDVPPQRLEEMPARGAWSARQSNYEAASSGIQAQVYDPRFTGYGDEYRGYEDVRLGNVRYYYTDVDAYKSPNFVIRNKVDHVDMQQPMGDTYSSYPREAALEDVRDIVNDDWMAKSTEFREDLMERQMRKSNARQWQLRFAPRSRGSNLSTFTSGY